MRVKTNSVDKVERLLRTLKKQMHENKIDVGFNSSSITRISCDLA